MEEEKISEGIALRSDERKPSAKESVLDFLKFAVIAAVIVLPIRLFIAQPFVVSGMSMVPTFEDGNYLVIDEISYRFEEPKRGEVIVFRLPQFPSRFLIKRIVGLPGESVQIRGNDILIKNESHPDWFLWEQGTIKPGVTHINTTVSLDDDEYFVLGDNRGESADSRIWGALPREMIVGRPFLRLLPLSEVDVFPGVWKEKMK